MRTTLRAAVAIFAILTLGSVAAWIVTDRAATLRSVEERTQSLARMISAHGDSALNDGNLIVSAVEGDVRRWDLRNETEGSRIYENLRALVVRSPLVAAAWIVDAGGTSRLNTWHYPSEPYSARDREYFRRHIAGAHSPVIAGDSTPGYVSGQKRFTYSRALLNSDGSLHAIIVVAILSNALDTLYREAANWPDARAGLYQGYGETLVELKSQTPASNRYINDVVEQIKPSHSGSALIADGGVPRIVSWQRSRVYPDLYATSSQSVGAALAGWTTRSLVLGAIAVIANVAFALFVWMSDRATVARETAKLNDIATREAHHRVKNSLQLIVAMVGLQSRTAAGHEREMLDHIGHQIRAVADAHQLLETSRSAGHIRVFALLRQICEYLRMEFRGEIGFIAGTGPELDAHKATSIAVILNEIVTNALKHAERTVEIACDSDATGLTVTVSDDGPGLPADFTMHNKERFGLRAALLLTTSIQGELTAGSRDRGGAQFRLFVPAAAGDRMNPGAPAAAPNLVDLSAARVSTRGRPTPVA
ncbi:MAG TPA: sensor histidine kinase [Alphaproteobacteria bacterium]|nr:sensor histidine kinase [Alphaproteobacteria bacterium]